MTDLTDASPADSLAGRPAGASVIAACLAEQAKLLPRKRFADVLGISPLADDAVPWFMGALGELTVGRELARLSPADGWVVLHAVPIGERDSDIDHVVIGPAGVFTINTKHHEGKRVSVGRCDVFVNGRNDRYIKKSVYEGARASKALTAAAGFDVVAQPVLAIVGAKEIHGRRSLMGVHVVDAAELVRWLRKRPPVWEADAARAVARVASVPGTWSASGSRASASAAAAGAVPFALADEANLVSFAELRRKVSIMARVRALWSLAGAVAVLAAAYGGVEVLMHATAHRG